MCLALSGGDNIQRKLSSSSDKYIIKPKQTLAMHALIFLVFFKSSCGDI